MKRVIQFISLTILSFMLVIGCDSMTGSESDLYQQNILSSETSDNAIKGGPTVIVSGDTFNPGKYAGWLFNRDQRTKTPYIFTFDQSSIGNGSLYIEPIQNDLNLDVPEEDRLSGSADKFIGELFLDEEIANVKSISYDFLIGSGGDVSDENHFYLNVYANFGVSDFDKYFDCKYDVVPSAGSTTEWTTITFDPTQEITNSNHVTTRDTSPYQCPATPADMDDLSPGSTIHFVSINVGDTSNDDQGLDGYYDNVTVDLDKGATTTYDFEPNCVDGNWEEFGFKNQGQCVRFVNTGKDGR